MTAYLIAVHILALIGVLAVLGVIGVLIFTAKFADPGSGTRPAPDVVAGHTSNVRIVPVGSPITTTHPAVPADVIDLRDRQPAPAPLDAGNATVGHALGVVLVVGGFLLLLGLAGAIEGGAW